MRRKVITSAKRTAQTTVGLLSLPDELLEKIALETCTQDDRYWARAAATCKRLSELQLFSDAVVEESPSEGNPNAALPKFTAWTLTQACRRWCFGSSEATWTYL